MYKLSERSLHKLEGVKEDLAKVVKKAIQITSCDFCVLEGLRTVTRQRQLYAQGRTAPGPIVTWTMASDHLWGGAVDLGAIVDGKYVDGNTKEEMVYYDQIANAMLGAAASLQIPIKHGIMREGKLTDVGHFSLNKAFYKEKRDA